MLRRIVVVPAAAAIVLIAAPQALACAGLVAPDGAVNLVRTTTLAAYADGVEHYITSFEFAGGGTKFGSIVPLPGIPSKVIKAGDWTLQRLIQETQPQPELRAAELASGDAAAVPMSAEVILETQVDALDITVLKGGGDEVGVWAKDNGFSLPPDAPEVLDFYADRSPIFMAASYNLERARDFELGDGIPVHLSIPTPNPWVPLRILGLGAQPSERIEADVYLLTENRPMLLPSPNLSSNLILERSEPASTSLLADLRSDRGMGWLPADDMWLTYLRVDAPAGELVHDLAIDNYGVATPSAVAAGLEPPRTTFDPDGGFDPMPVVIVVAIATLLIAFIRWLLADTHDSSRPAF